MVDRPSSLAHLHLLDVAWDVKLAVEHLLHLLGKFHVVRVIKVVGLTVDFLTDEEALNLLGVLANIDGSLALIGSIHCYNHLWLSVYVFLHRHLRHRVFVADVNAEDVAEQVGNVVVVLFGDVALVELRFILRQSSQRLVEDGLYGSACIACPHTVVSHHHHFVGVARRHGG